MSIYYNYTLAAAVISWGIAQIIKTIIHAIRNKTFKAERLIGSGGMPSSHSALVCSASVATFRICGPQSVEFALMLIVALIVMYDAMGVRRAAGLHAHEINNMKKIFAIKGINTSDEDDTSKKKKKKELKEYLGHTPFEVLGGALLGILISMLMPMSI